MKRALAVLIVGCIAGCAHQVTVPKPESTPLAPARWTLHLREPARPDFPPLALNFASNGEVIVTYARLSNVNYRLSGERLESLVKTVESSSKDWPPSGTPVEPSITLERDGKTVQLPGEPPANLIDALHGIVPRPFAKDPDGQWAGGRLVHSQPEGHGIDLVLQDSEDAPADQRLTLVPPPEMGFETGDVVIVSGHPGSDEAGVEQNGHLYSVQGICAWPHKVEPREVHPGKPTPTPKK